MARKFSSDAERKAAMANMNRGGGSKKKVSRQEPVARISGTSGNKMLRTQIDTTPKEIGELSGNERSVVEDFVESKITTVTDAGFDGKIYRFSNGEDWYAFDSKKDAEKEARSIVMQDLEDQPQIFKDDFIFNHISITKADKKIISNEEAEAQRESIEKEVMKDKPDLEEGSDEFDEIVDKRVDKIADGIEPMLSDPVEYFVNDENLFTKKELLQQDFITIDVPAATDEAIQIEGIGHFLAKHDGKELVAKDPGEDFDLLLFRVN